MRQNIDEQWKTDPRRTALAERIGGRSADGMRVEINWLLLDHRGKPVPLKKFQFVKDWQAWVDCGLAEVKGEFVEIAGADAYAEFFDKQKANGSKPKKAKRSQKKPKQAKESQTKPTKPSSSFSFSSSSSPSSSEGLKNPPAEAVAPNDLDLNRRIWDAYSLAYLNRYGTEPVRNAAVNSKIKQVGQRLGDEAPDVAAFYLTIGKSYYVNNLHPVGALLNDCEALRTQWATGKTMSNTLANQTDQSTALREQLKRFGGTK